MKINLVSFVLMFLFSFNAFSQENAFNETNLKMLDSKYEKALLESDEDFLNELLADEFIWVHNHNSMTDTKEALLKRASDPNVKATGNTKARTQKDVQVIIKGLTAIVTGLTVVDRGPTPTTYHFMRTYIAFDGKCFLLANHTMAVP